MVALAVGGGGGGTKRRGGTGAAAPQGMPKIHICLWWPNARYIRVNCAAANGPLKAWPFFVHSPPGVVSGIHRIRPRRLVWGTPGTAEPWIAAGCVDEMVPDRPPRGCPGEDAQFSILDEAPAIAVFVVSSEGVPSEIRPGSPRKHYHETWSAGLCGLWSLPWTCW